ncbi:MAG: hypothetical protein ABJM29_18790 [Rhizobiaceae bacterium]
MDHITQLKNIRAEAITRLRDSDDFKLAGKLGQLIVELGDTVDDVAVLSALSTQKPLAEVNPLPIQAKEPAPTPSFESAFMALREQREPEAKNEDMIEELRAEFEDGEAGFGILSTDRSAGFADADSEAADIDDVSEIEEIAEIVACSNKEKIAEVEVALNEEVDEETSAVTAASGGAAAGDEEKADAEEAADSNGPSSFSSYFKTDRTESRLTNGAAH